MLPWTSLSFASSSISTSAHISLGFLCAGTIWSTIVVVCVLGLLLYMTLAVTKHFMPIVGPKRSHVYTKNISNARINHNANGRRRKVGNRLKNKKMAGNAQSQTSQKKNTKASLSTYDEPSAGTTHRLKRRSLDGCKDISNSLPCKRQSPKKSNSESNFSHPVYRSISSRNGEINRMTHEQLKSSLRELNLDPCGYPDILRKRLKQVYSQTTLGKAGLDFDQTTQNYDYLCVIDFEATCERQNPADYLHEIIEFPIVLVNTKTRHVEDTIMLFCKPLLNPKLSEFCTRLTNITQCQVDYADTFPIVLEKVNHWIQVKELGSKYSFAIVTDGPWDINMFLRVQCKLSKVTFPSYAKTWINLSKTFSNYYKTNRVKLELMLNNLGMEFEGRPHRGIDDAKNIARIAVKLMEDGCNLAINDTLT